MRGTLAFLTPERYHSNTDGETRAHDTVGGADGGEGLLKYFTPHLSRLHQQSKTAYFISSRVNLKYLDG